MKLMASAASTTAESLTIYANSSNKGKMNTMLPYTKRAPTLVACACLWSVSVSTLLGTVGCSDQEDGRAAVSSRAARALREQFPEQAPVVLQREHSFKKTETGFALRDPGPEGSWRSVKMELPIEGQQLMRIKTLSGLEIRVREIGTEGPGEIAEQAVSYPRRDGTSYWTASPGAYEEWMHIRASAVKSHTAVAEWQVEGVDLRQADDAVELLDGSGAVQMRVTAPEAYAVGLGAVKVHLTGADGKIQLYVEANGVDVLVDPVWSAAATMTVARAGFTGTLLPDGRVLATGGYNSVSVHQTAETYNPASNTWSATANTMGAARGDHAAVLMPNNKVLVVGGKDGSSYLSSAEVFDPATNLWSPTASMANTRSSLLAVLLGNGKVLVAGGRNTITPKVAELYDPVAGTWSNTGNMITSRHLHTATLLNNGKVLVAGGAYINSAELYDPAMGTWTATGAMTTARGYHTATLLNDGTVLVVGGYNGSTYLQSAELYNPASGSWSSVGVGSMSAARIRHTATLLNNGRVLIAGGSNGFVLASTEQYNPVTKQFSSAGTMTATRDIATAVRLQDGTVLDAGGYVTATTDRYLLPLTTSCTIGASCQSGLCVDGVCCNVACGNGDNTDCQACNVAGSEGLCAPSSSGFICRAPSDVCDVVETCDGVATTCPPDAVESAGTVCRPIAAGSNCDVPEACTGADKACPADGFKPAGSLCRAAADICDVTESCTGAMAFCPPDAFVPSGTQCRAAAGVCDIAESCLGNSPSCPANVFVAAGTQCLNGPGLCSAANACSGNNATCP